MSRNNFIERLIKIDYSFFVDKSDELEKFLIERMKERGFKTLKELFSQGGWDNIYIEINFTKIRQLTQSYDESINPFIKLYSLSDDYLYSFFSIFYKTHFALKYYNDYCEDYRGLKERNKGSRNTHPLRNAIDRVLNEIKTLRSEQDDDETKKVINYLENLKGTLENRHYTKQQVYQDFFYNIHNLFIDEEYEDEHKKVQKFKKTDITNIVNGIIKNYFQDDASEFKGYLDFNKYESYKYNYHTKAGITLTHPKFQI